MLAVGLLIALLPLLYELRLRRKLRALTGDPTLPNHIALSQVTRTLLAVLVSPFVALLTDRAGLAVLPFVVAIVASVDTRRAVYGETWSRAARLRQGAGFAAMLLGPAVLAVPAPLLAAPLGWAGVGVGAGLLALGLAWLARPVATARLLLRHEPLPAELESRLQAMSARTDLPDVRLAAIGAAGGLLANALAVSDRSGGASLIGRTLLDELPPEQIEAVHAHELAHLEAHRGPTLERDRLQAVTLLLLGCIAAPTLLAVLDRPGGAAVGLALSFGAVLLASRLRHGPDEESASDRRAVELGADPEALIEALVALHTFARIPRRFSASAERANTHPSLGRRIQAIREAFDLPLPPAPPPTWVRGHDRGTLIRFDADRVLVLHGLTAEWEQQLLALDGDALAEAVGALPANRIQATHEADAIAELQLAPHVPKGRSLIVAGATGRATVVRLADQDLGPTNAWLEHLDTRLAAPGARATQQGRTLTRLVAGTLGLLCVVSLGPTLLVPLLFAALLLPRRETTAALGFGAALAGVLAMTVPDFLLPWWNAMMWAPVWTLLGGIAVLAVPLSGPAEGKERGGVRLVALGLFVLAAVHLQFLPDHLTGTDRFALALRGHPHGIVLAAGAAALAGLSRFEQGLAIGLLLPLTFGAVAATPLGLRALGEDPLLQEGKALVVPKAKPTLQWSRRAPGGEDPGGVRVAPAGGAVALWRTVPYRPLSTDENAHNGRVWSLAEPDGDWVHLPGVDLQWLDARSFAVLQRDEWRGRVRRGRLVDGAVQWVDDGVELPLLLDQPHLSVSPSEGRFWVVDHDLHGTAQLRIDGAFGEANPRVRKWELEEPIVVGGGHLVAPGPGDHAPLFERLHTVASDRPGPREPLIPISRLHRDGAPGPDTTHLPVAVAPLPGGDVALAADDGARTLLWRWTTDALTPVCALPYPRPFLEVAPDGTAAILATGHLLVGDAATCAFVEIPDAPRCLYTQAFAASNGAIALLSYCRDEHVVRVYDGPEAPGSPPGVREDP